MNYSFPLIYLHNNILFPETVIPLTISDNLSIDLITECSKQKMPLIFYYLPPSNTARHSKTATLGNVIHIEKKGDKYTVLVEGDVRVHLLIQIKSKPFPVYQVEAFHDQKNDNIIALNNLVERLQLIFHNWIERRPIGASEKETIIQNIKSTQSLINYLSLLVIKDIELKSIFLESILLSERIQMMNSLLKGDSPESEDPLIKDAIKRFESF